MHVGQKHHNMEVDPPTAQLPPPARLTVNLGRAPRRNLSVKSQRAPKTGIRDTKRNRSPPRPTTKDTFKLPTTKTHLSPVTTIKPLLPAAERHKPGLSAAIGKKDGDGEKNSIVPDGGSAGREGRKFTVANVGNNGRIFLRPTIRPANQRYPQPNFVFPMSPPRTAGLEPAAMSKNLKDEKSAVEGSQLTTFSETPSPGVPLRKAYFEHRSSVRPMHRRAMSDSTIQESSVAHEGDTGAFKVIISKPQEDLKAKTAEDVDSNGFLQVSIPSWKLGTPRFSTRGTPFIRGSSYAPTEEYRLSSNSFYRRTPLDRNSLYPDSIAPGMVSPSESNAQFQSSTLLSPFSASIQQPRLPAPSRTTFIPSSIEIRPSMFDALTFRPSCNDRSIVRLSPTSGAVTAATPARLVAEITSPTFLDYELISDFFLSFRSFLEPSVLLQMLVARFRWALAREDEVGTVVRVRTFVAIRHWLLNYFIDDFVVDYQLRLSFCLLINNFVEDLIEDGHLNRPQMKIVTELKKCWRRICAQYWDGPEFDAMQEPEALITPGGIAGHRDPKLDPTFWDSNDDDKAPQLQELELSDEAKGPSTSFYTDVARAGHMDSIVLEGRRPGTPEHRPTDRLQRLETSPTSVASLDVMSCSFPARAIKTAPDQSGAAHALGAHPVDPSSVYTSPDPVASTPRALTGKRVRPQQPHRRNVSQSDSLHEHGTRGERVMHKNSEFVIAMPYAGSLVRGNLLPPGQAFVDMGPPSTIRDSRQTILQASLHGALKEKPTGSAMSSQGMRRLMGSVRRVLRARGSNTTPGPSDFILLNSNGSHGVTTNRIPGTAVIPRSYDRVTGLQHPLRVDLLGATVADHFKEAVKEENSTLSRDSQGAARTSQGGPGAMKYSPVAMEDSHGMDFRPFSDGGITTGSKSIVIVDGTMALDFSAMAGALPGTVPGFNNSVDGFTDGHMAASELNLTPPTTPPGNGARGNTPRRSSFILSQHVHQPSLDTNPLPPFIPDLATLDQRAASGVLTEAGPLATAAQSPQSQQPRPATSSNRQSTRKPPSSFVRHHRRQMSSRSYRSRGSLAHRRFASIQSAIGAASVRSFDATTISGASIISEVMPPPLRVLRRRPGGDLRGVAHVTDLDGPALHRSHSDGSLTTYSESCRSPSLQLQRRNSSGFVDIVSGDYSHYRSEVFSLGAMADQGPKNRNTHFSTHSSKPIMRPSFEAEAQKLAQIPDDIDDDGGVESALLKLEGRYEKKPPRLSIDHTAGSLAAQPDGLANEDADKEQHRHQHVGEETVGMVDATGGPTAQSSLLVPGRSGIVSFLSEASKDSYNSIPLLERDSTPEGRRIHESREWTNKSILMPDTPQDEHPDTFESLPAPVAGQPSRRNRNDAETKEVHSFLDCDTDGASDISSELSTEEFLERDDERELKPSTMQSSLSENSPTTDGHAVETSTTNLVDLPSPPISLREALALDPEAALVPALQDHQIWSQKQGTASANNVSDLAMYHNSLERGQLGVGDGPHDTMAFNAASAQRFSIHLPFILAFDSEILAQQFTLIEKDALNEIDWRELIDMRWKNDNTDPRSWVEFLRNPDTHGVEVVIARFNIMVKWVISEIVLTQDVNERSRCIQKYLHIASHCRKYRNFATMSQIAIALTSNEIARLARTWSMVPQADLRTMAELEMLVSPTKNFYNLRAEMEGGGNTPELGCIPFVGIYTHDLLFNAQRPSEVASSPLTPPLVNFERCRIAASIVKTLLRLLEASTQYYFQPVEGIIERCLWMSALSDEQIRKNSELLE
ncbi:uncharacterized protein B0I36DRAFT_4346 [Microdochium trichocladiopsis]|uniref:Guanine nucleotide exchange factor LTE1 n=1 Tax=Microdochium trichocladiopsis TaxID=1682393 RepID=A0A9P8YHA9_9PEZI|nr:uncharacterized protein B0I36DRAFT_4346 [Microdochium trichocladiopsis]KAH7039997.1 hypothetical protein B0I36DRAFT_4346 [Microdochium trichocladiopsis]